MPAQELTPYIAAPPRQVPLSVRAHVVFGGFYNQLGWFLFGFGMVFAWIFVLNADLSVLYFGLGSSPAAGQVLRVDLTPASENDAPVYEVEYEFLAGNGRRFQSRSYSTGYAPPVGSLVTVEYWRNDPRMSRVEGMRRAIFGPAAALALIFPAAGLGFLGYGLAQGIKADQLLWRGRTAPGKLVGTRSTGMSINHRPVLELTFEFDAIDGGRYQVKARTHQPHQLTDQTEEMLLYDPAEPEYAVMLDSLPGTPGFDSAGQIQPTSWWRALQALILPALTVLGHGGYWLLR
jgi:hypothetical protein